MHHVEDVTDHHMDCPRYELNLRVHVCHYDTDVTMHNKLTTFISGCHNLQQVTDTSVSSVHKEDVVS